MEDICPTILFHPSDHQVAEQTPSACSPDTNKSPRPAKRTPKSLLTTRRSNFRRSRAAAACRSCRARKVRCDVVAHGSPCYNCQQDSVICVLPTKRKRCWRYEDHDYIITPEGGIPQFENENESTLLNVSVFVHVISSIGLTKEESG